MPSPFALPMPAPEKGLEWPFGKRDDSPAWRTGSPWPELPYAERMKALAIMARYNRETLG